MSDTKIQKSGHCLCGKVSYTAQVSSGVGACHCSMCQRWTGSAFMAVDAGSDIEFKGEESIARYNSSEWAERGFCKACGTSLFYHLKQHDQYIMVLGTLDDVEGLAFDHQIFVEEKSPVYQFANQTREMTGEEVFAAFAPE